MSKVLLLVKTRTQPGKRDAVRRLYEARLAPRVRDNAAQELVVWATDDQDPDVFYLAEVYRDAESMAANGQEPWFFEYLAEAGPLLAGMPEVMVGTPAWAKGIDL